MIDVIDKAILNILQQDGRTSNADIARQINLAPSAVLERIRKLEERKVIRGYSADIDSKALDFGLTSIIAIRTSECGEGVGELLSAVPEVQEVHAAPIGARVNARTSQTNASPRRRARCKCHSG